VEETGPPAPLDAAPASPAYINSKVGYSPPSSRYICQ
jgi:hypothetical protein